ncbi:MAG TPA: hypothetical protein VHY35_14085 [Stellaceae bacterium]|jgi:hypothetical protein|nr:hypothetical protein [Stellaceae bacterium]
MRRRFSPVEICLGAAVVACAIVALIAVRHVGVAAQAWLAAYLFWVGPPVGALYLVLVHGLTGGAWGLTLRPGLAAMLRAMPLLALFLVPVLLGARHIYPWAASGGRDWLYLPFFAARAVVYVVLWNVIAVGAMRRVRPDGWLPPGFAWPALILLFASTTLAAFDWLMTLEPGWTSTIFGLLVSSAWVLSALSGALVIAAWPRVLGMTEPLDAPARILLALVLLWAYLSVIQLVVVWESDLSHEIPWYLRRSAGGWEWVALTVAAFQFVVPFLVLMWRKLRQSRKAVLAAASSVLVAHLAETWWLAVPDFGRAFGWADALAFIGMGAAFLFVAGRDLDPLAARPGHAGD